MTLGRMHSVPTPAGAEPALPDALDQVLAVVEGSPAGSTLPASALAEARAGALAMGGAFGASREGQALAKLGYASDLLGAIAVDLAADTRQATELMRALEDRAFVPRAALGRELLRGGRLLELPVELAVEVQLALLLVFTSARSTSLWIRSAETGEEYIAHAGELGSSPRAVLAARDALADESRHPLLNANTLAVRVDAMRPPAAAVVADGVVPDAPLLAPLLAAAAPTLASLLDRRTMLNRERSQESMASTIERRLARLRFDLHDGPQQDVHLLAQDLRLFRDQLRPMVAGDPNERRALGRLDDLEAQLVALDGDLRRLCTAVQSPLLAPGSLRDALTPLAEAFTARTGIVPELKVDEQPAQLSDSQQIAVLSLAREALSNIRKHSGARAVSIAIGTRADGSTVVEITDDGTGFDPEETLVRAAQAGRLGLVGMHERVRMLGGRTQIDSRPGGPTVITATLPRWPAE
jgi:signal transduction histidine kinase